MLIGARKHGKQVRPLLSTLTLTTSTTPTLATSMHPKFCESHRWKAGGNEQSGTKTLCELQANGRYAGYCEGSVRHWWADGINVVDKVCNILWLWPKKLCTATWTTLPIKTLSEANLTCVCVQIELLVRMQLHRLAASPSDLTLGCHSCAIVMRFV